MHPTTTSRRQPLPALVALVLLAALAAVSLWTVWPSPPKGADAPADQFSAGRAFAHVQTIGRRVHPGGSAAAADVRRYIVDTLTSLGLDPQVESGTGETAALGTSYGMAHVENVTAVLHGSASTGTVYLVGHYDSVQVSHGANDDGASVAALLETVRALMAGPRPKNDLVFLFTDEEESCLCGAESFVHSSPLARGGGVALNFESRGSSGPSIMFETSRGNAAVVNAYASVPHPVGSSMAVEVYRILPNDTDFTEFREDPRFTGLNSAYIDGSATYHSPEDAPAYMDQASLQQHGDNALALARTFGAADIARLRTPSSDDATYFPVLGGLARYPGRLTWPLALAAVLAVAGLAVLSVRRGRTTGRRVAAGVAWGLVPIVGAAVVAQAMWAAMVAIRPGYGEMLDPWRPWWFRVALVLLVAAVLLGWCAALRRRVGAGALAIGGLAWLAVLGVVLAAVTPGGSYLTALPALAGGVGGMLALWWRERRQTRGARVGALAVDTLAAAVGVVVLAPIVLLFFPALGLATGAAPALFAVLLGLALLPVLGRALPARGRRAAIPGLVAFVAALGCVATGLVVDRFDAVHPRPTQLMYALDADSGQAWWVSAESRPSPWTSRFVGGEQDLTAKFPILRPDEHVGPAQAADLPPSKVTTISDTTTGDRRTLVLSVEPQRQVRLVGMTLENARAVRATVEGRDVPLAGGAFDIVFNAPPADGVRVTLVVPAGAHPALRVADGSDGLSGLPGWQPRPTGDGIEGSHTSALLMVGTTVSL